MDINFHPMTDEDRPYVWRLYREAMQGHIDKIWGWDESWQVPGHKVLVALSCQN